MSLASHPARGVAVLGLVVVTAVAVGACARDGTGRAAPPQSARHAQAGSVTRATDSTANPTWSMPTTSRAAVSTTTTRPAAASTRPSGPSLLFGIGPEANAARTSALARQAPVRMLTSWYNGPGDLSWMAGWRAGEVPRAYAAGYHLHLIVYTGDEEGPIATPHGQACGRRYPLSERFLDDMGRLARIFAGPAGGPRLYVSLFTEFQTYPCRVIDYVVLGPLAPTTMRDLPLVAAAIEHSEVMASFGDGEITVRRVSKDAPD